MSSIYERQMKKLQLNERQYSKLLGIPVNVLKKIIKNERVSEDMSLDEFFRKSAIKAHEDVEKDLENAKIKSLEIRNEEKNEIDYMKWYNEQYETKQLLNIAECKSIREFEDRYYIEVNGKKASHWFYGCIVSKKINYKKGISRVVLQAFIEQLYDIVVNGNVEKYRNEKQAECEKDELDKWFDEFDLNKFMKEYNLSKEEVCEKVGIANSTLWAIRGGNYKTSKTTKAKIKKYVDELTLNRATIGVEKNKFTETKTTDIIDVKTSENDLLKEILKSRLTEQEKILIYMFGGRID